MVLGASCKGGVAVGGDRGQKGGREADTGTEGGRVGVGGGGMTDGRQGQQQHRRGCRCRLHGDGLVEEGGLLAGLCVRGWAGESDEQSVERRSGRWWGG